MKVNTTTQLLITAVIFALLSMAVYGGLFFLIKKGNENISKTKGEIDISLKQEQQIKGAQNLLKDIEKDEEELNAYLIEDEEVVPFLESIEALSAVTGADIEVTSVSIEPHVYGESENTAVEFLRLVVVARGAWEEVFHAAALLESVPKGAYVSQVGLTQAGEEGWSSIMDIRFTKVK